MIGTVGKTGKAVTGSHLHFAVKRDGKEINPLSVIDPFGGSELYQKFALLYDQKTKKVGTVLIPGSQDCPAGTLPRGPWIGNPLGGFDACTFTGGKVDLFGETFDTTAGWENLPGGEAIAGTLGGIEAVGGFFVGLGGFLFDPQNWIRLGALTGGVVLLGFGTVWVVRAT